MTKRSKPLISVFLALFLAAAFVPASPLSASADTEEAIPSADSAATDAAAGSATAQGTEGAKTTPPQSLTIAQIF